MINIVSARPKIGATEGYIALNVGDYNLLKGESVINFPVSDNWAMRFGLLANKSDSYTKDSGGWSATRYGLGVRGQLRYQPSEDVSVNFMINATQSKRTNEQQKVSIENKAIEVSLPEISIPPSVRVT